MQFEENLSLIYLLFFKSKIVLAEAHLMRSPKNFINKFGNMLNPSYELEVLDYLVQRESPAYKELSRNCWILYVIEITKILSSSKAEKFSIKKFYNKLHNKEFDQNLDLTCFHSIISKIEDLDINNPIYKLKILRDRYYAHADLDFNKMSDELFPTYNEAWEIMDDISFLLKSIYGQNDADIDLNVQRELEKYFHEFYRLYRYFQITNDFGEIYRLKKFIGAERFEDFRNNQIDDHLYYNRIRFI